MLPRFLQQDLRISTRQAFLIALALCGIFLLLNRAAYKGYFQSDDLDNLTWTVKLTPVEYLQAIFDPMITRANFRPAGHIFYNLVAARYGLYFPAYLAVLQTIHLLNGVLVFLLLRRLFADNIAALVGMAFFLFHRATFDAYWKPMYIFDVVCCTFVLACFLLYLNGQTFLSLLCFWITMRAKEVAILLPVVLAIYELWLGPRAWRRLLPFFSVSAWLGVQALINNANVKVKDDYTLRFSRAFVVITGRYYLRALFVSAIAGLAVLASTIVVRGKAYRFGVAGAILLLTPMLLLPNRLFSVYVYVSLVLWSVALAALMVRYPYARRFAPALVVLLWVPTYGSLRRYRNDELAIAADNRAYVDAVAAFCRAHPTTRSFIYDGRPTRLALWGVEGAIRIQHPEQTLDMVPQESPDAKRLLTGTSEVGILSWDEQLHRLNTTYRASVQANESYISVERSTPVWQLGNGWQAREGAFRWIESHAEVTMRQPADARLFEIVVNVNADQVERRGPFEIRVTAGGDAIGSVTVQRTGVQTFRWPVPPMGRDAVKIAFDVAPPLRLPNDDRSLGTAMMAWGYRVP